MDKTTGLSSKQLVDHIIEGIQEKKGKNISTIDLQTLEHASCDYFIVCEGSSTTQVEAIAGSVEHQVRMQLHEYPLHIEGLRTAQWVILDYGNVMVHVFLDEIRHYYKLENLWADGKMHRVPAL